jgi:hypothetical protein
VGVISHIGGRKTPAYGALPICSTAQRTDVAQDGHGFFLLGIASVTLPLAS